ncbi:glycoside hydrolase family 31 protein [Blautia sp.]|uniref:glycoside hydrolase family 31 protein n=1 Tax=Blautia sp. TaxID=1955243 RepID=UPI00258F4918|nr:glycoside hydrolase family 31 protein [Blautia sp.]
MKEIYRVQTAPKALEDNQIRGAHYRITVLTERLLRLEYDRDEVFEDRSTQVVFDRDFPKAAYEAKRTKEGLEIRTEFLHLVYNEKEFSSNGLSIQVGGRNSNYRSIWRYGDQGENLKGTARTLDGAEGEIPLDDGVMSQMGFALLDDSKSQVLLENGWIEPRKKEIRDLYFFGYGHDYKGALQAFYRLCRKPPMLPRYALGNWWSRYYPYTEESYLELMDRFERENLPFTVAVIDMDWHLVDIEEKYGSGWTGYTWNRAFFPKPIRFLERLHEKGMRTTLNLHPADGVRAFEEMYEPMAKAMGVDIEKQEPVLCDLANPDFLEAYFTCLHHPREEEGVDFWWIDWQQGNTTKIEGLDSLWILNHFHFLDHQRTGKRPLLFSRYAGPGSHRYSVGFSGDTITTWESLQFQPYFTAVASNIGYGWWSHDIGGHMLGYKDDEMTARWTQFGVYSPILRLHSSNSEFNGKEPWRFKPETEKAMGEALRERHRLLPYLYTMNYRAYKEGLPLVQPMYYEYPENGEAYYVKNQYLFGSVLMVAPVTSPREKGINRAKTVVWLPEGLWYDLYTGMMYSGDRMLVMYRSIESIPVLAKAGGILPLTEEIRGTEAGRNPKSLHIKVFTGASGDFVLYEDDNETCAYEKGSCVKTSMSYREEKEEVVFEIRRPKGALELIPQRRTYRVDFVGMKDIAKEQIRVCIDGKEVQAVVSYNRKLQAVEVCVGEVSIEQEVRVVFTGELQRAENQVEERCFAFLDQAEISFVEKDRIYNLVKNKKPAAEILAELLAQGTDRELYGVIAELLTGKS